MDQGWIKLYRSIEESAIWGDPLRLKAWIWILLHANYEDKDWFLNGSLMKIKKGQTFTSIRHLSEAWKCSTKTTRRVLQQLTELGMISVDTSSKRGTLLTVVKYGFFQSGGHTEEHTKEHTEGYTEGHTEVTQLKKVKNDIKKVKKEKNNSAFGGSFFEGTPE